ncbi:MAG: asparagine synthetase B [Candidatus Delongbacteria bacterium]|nr:asparagine synthetase B [Candidatus Delongbacteria bacterium]
MNLNKFLIIFLFATFIVRAEDILIPMDWDQEDHLKAYGLAYWSIDRGAKVEWLLNYRGGSFKIEGYENIINEAVVRGVSYELISQSDFASIANEILQSNMEIVELEKAPKVAIYTPEGKFPWDDAVTLALTYAEIPYETLWDKEVLRGDLSKYDWLHLHHEDFTGQYGKFLAGHGRDSWYKDQVRRFEELAKQLGYSKVSKEKLSVVIKIKQFVMQGGFLFAMCSAADTFDIALAAYKTDICESVFDGDPIDPNFQSKIDYSQCLAFKDFKLELNPYVYEYSDIDMSMEINMSVPEKNDYFTLFDFSAKFDPIASILTQNHTKILKGFMGQTTAFRRKLIKKNVVILGDVKNTEMVKYIYAPLGQGFFTFYGGHDPEDYKHYVMDPPTELEMYKNSPGYRLILNNILFPATNKKKRKT